LKAFCLLKLNHAAAKSVTERLNFKRRSVFAR